MALSLRRKTSLKLPYQDAFVEAWILYSVVVLCIGGSSGMIGRILDNPWVGMVTSFLLVLWVNRWFTAKMKATRGA